MGQYSVYAFCDQCGDPHPTGMGMRLPDSRDEPAVGDTYDGKPVPSNCQMTGNRFMCPTKGRMATQKDNSDVFLVRTG